MVTDDGKSLIHPYWDDELNRVILACSNPINGDLEYTGHLGLQEAQELANKIGLIVEEQTQ